MLAPVKLKGTQNRIFYSHQKIKNKLENLIKSAMTENKCDNIKTLLSVFYHFLILSSLSN